MSLLCARIKMGVDVSFQTCADAVACFVNGNLRAMIAPDDDREVAFWRLWSAETKFRPFTVVRRDCKGRYRKVAESFVPMDKEVTRIRADWHRARINFA